MVQPINTQAEQFAIFEAGLSHERAIQHGLDRYHELQAVFPRPEEHHDHYPHQAPDIEHISKMLDRQIRSGTME